MNVLRNKKTGELIESEYMMLVQITSTKGERNLLFDNLTHFNNEWEDYETTKPLIKDEKIRKAVKAWADVKGTYYVKKESDYSLSGFECNISFTDKAFSDLKESKEYTITQLCGEGNK